MAIFNSYVKLPEGSSGISQPRLIFHRSVEKGVQPPDWQVFYCRLRMSNTPKPSTPSAGVPLLWWLRRQRVKSEMPWCVDPICREGWVSCWGEYMRFFFCMLYQYHDINISITYNMRSSQCICMYIYIHILCTYRLILDSDNCGSYDGKWQATGSNPRTSIGEQGPHWSKYMRGPIQSNYCICMSQMQSYLLID